MVLDYPMGKLQKEVRSCILSAWTIISKLQ